MERDRQAERERGEREGGKRINGGSEMKERFTEGRRKKQRANSKRK